MINIKSVISLAMAEIRLTRRLVRFWVFLLLSYALVFLIYLALSALHGYGSTVSATAGFLCPKYLVSSYGGIYLMIYSVGVIFLAFDIRSRDKRERIAEVLDSRPYTNFELVLGRFLGILIPAWVPFILLGILLELLGLLLAGMGFPFGEPLEMYSFLAYIFLISLPALAFVISLVFFTTLLVRNRLVASLTLLILLGISYWGIIQFPVCQGQLFDFFGSLQLKFPSDVMISVMDFDGVLHRIAILLASFGILLLSAAVHPRLDDGSRSKTGIGGAVIVAISVILIGTIYINDVKNIEKPDIWLTAHSAYSQAPVPDLKTVSGKVKIIPGKSLDLDLDITFAAPESGSIKNAVFTLNPGQKITKVFDLSGKQLNYTHENGVLDITLSEALPPLKETGIKLSISGVPDKHFAYLKSALDPRTIKARNNNLALLGDQNSIYDSRFVALMPAIRWLPASGPENERDNPRIRPIDYFKVDLSVKIPKGWLVAGPGRRHIVEEKEDYSVFRFSPPSFVPEVALIASEFESRSFEVENVFMEFLVHRKHVKNMEILADTGEKIKEYASVRLKEANETGLAYPYDGFSLVEVPASLRTYGGGWRMDTVQNNPGIFLIKELSLPTARFDTAFRKPERFKNREGGVAQAKWERLQTFFKNDFSGGNVLTGMPRNFFLYQTSAIGPESPPLNFVFETLSNLLISDTKGYYSTHLYVAGNEAETPLTSIFINFEQLRGLGITFSETFISGMASQPRIWEKILKDSLKELDPWEDPADTVNILTLKGYAISDTIFNTLGREKTAELLATVRKKYQGECFSIDDIIGIGNSLGHNLDELLGEPINSTMLPGFVVPEAEGYRIADDENGNPRYQLLFTVRNDEPMPGSFYFAYYYPPGKKQKAELVKSETIRLAGKQKLKYGTIVSRPPAMCFFAPYLSLNRDSFKLDMQQIDPDKFIDKAPIEGINELPWDPPVSKSIIIDDLDDGFSIAEEDRKDWSSLFRLKSFFKTEQQMDQGLPYLSLGSLILPAPEEWTRFSNGAAWGKYRHTTAIISNGNGSKKALFSANLAKNGELDLELHLPMKSVFPAKKWGTWNIIVKDSNGDQHNVKFNSEAGIDGWNFVEKMDLPEGKVTVEISNKTDGNIVIADAIRWIPDEASEFTGNAARIK